jgi:transposase
VKSPPRQLLQLVGKSQPQAKAKHRSTRPRCRRAAIVAPVARDVASFALGRGVVPLPANDATSAAGWGTSIRIVIERGRGKLCRHPGTAVASSGGMPMQAHVYCWTLVRLSGVTANVFCVVEPKAGKHFTFPTPDRSAPELAQVLERILRSYRDADTVHLVMDNLNIHCRKTLTDFYGEELGSFLWSRFTAHYTPKHGSWLNQAEIEISLFARQCLGKRRIPNLATVRHQASAWNRQVNRRRVKIDWQFTRRKARLVFGYEPHSFMRS